MITAYTGCAGSGKTYGLLKEANKAIIEGKNVYTNLVLKDTNYIFTKHFFDYAFPDNCVVLIDEAESLLRSSKWKNERFENIDLFVALQSTRFLDDSISIKECKRIT